MSVWRRLFGGLSEAERAAQKTADSTLLATFLSLEQQRLTATAALEEQRHKMELRRLEIEIENAEILQKVKQEDREAAARLRQQQRDWAAASREKKRLAAEKRVASSTSADPTACPVCRGDMNLTTGDIQWHYSGHTNREMDLFH